MVLRSSALSVCGVTMWRVRAVQQKVSGAYYSYGLYCATHQLLMIGISFLTFCFVCYPLTRLPFLGSVPSRYVTPAAGYQAPPRATATAASSGLGSDSSGSSGVGGDPAPAWWNGPPAGYVQQILVKASVAPWSARSLHALDAFRGPLHTVFDIIDTVGYVRRAVDTPDSAASAAAAAATVGAASEPWTFDEACLRVAEPRRAPGWRADVATALPEYGCLLLSPAALWGGSRQRFCADRDPLRTVYADVGGQYETLAGSPNLREVLFGVPWSESGVSKYYVRTRQRTIYYAVTLVLRNYSAGLPAALRARLLDKYPLSALNYRRGSEANASGAGVDDFLTHVTYGRTENAFLAAYVFDNLPLIVAYVVLFLYIYFSVQKIEMVKSKWGLALSAVATVVASLLMSFSICVSFGMRPSVSGSDIFPYLVVIVGLENMMVLTRAVASTPLELEVPLRVAQGLGCEGWNISKYLLTELAVLVTGFFMLVPAVQEFCLFAIVGLFVDFFLQMTFFATVLSIDIRRLELEDLNRHLRHQVYGSRMDVAFAPTRPVLVGGGSAGAMAHGGALGAAAFAGATQPQHGGASNHLFAGYSFFAVPRRIRLMNFVAQKRCMQTLIIMTVLVWIVAFLYNAGSISGLLQSAYTREQEAASAALLAVAEAAHDEALPDVVRRVLAPDSPLLASIGQVLHAGGRGGGGGDSAGGGYLDITGRSAADNWERLSFLHWPAVFAFYNVSLAGTYVTFLPSIKISLLVSPDEAVTLRKAAGGSGSGDLKDDKAEEDDAAATAGDDVMLPAVGVGRHSQDDRNSIAAAAAADHEAAGATVGGEPSLLQGLGLTSGLLLNMTMGLRGTSTLTGSAVLIFAAAAVVLVFAFACVTLYSCMCGRNYHEWRPRWFRSYGDRSRGGRGGSVRARWRRHLTEGTVLSLDGHRQPVECAAVDGSLAVTSCLGGEIRVWDPAAGQAVTAVLRKSVAAATAATAEPADASRPSTPRSPLAEADGRSRTHSSSSAAFGDLSAFIETDFSSLSPRTFASCLEELSERRRTEQPALPAVAVAAAAAASSPGLLQRVSEVTSSRLAATAAVAANGSWAGSPFYAGGTGSGSRDSLQELCPAFDQLPPHPETWPSIWCVTLRDGLVAAGCSDGTVELWDAVTGALRGTYRPASGGGAGVTVVKLDGNRLLVGRADGTVDFVDIAHEVVDRRLTSSTPSSMAAVAHGRRGSRSSAGVWLDEDVHCTHLRSIKAHQGAVHFLEVGGGRAVTAGGGGQDASVLKVYSLDETCLLHALRGQAQFSAEHRRHRAPARTAVSAAIVSALHIDTSALPHLAVSGNRVGGVFVWDLHNGQNLHSWNVSRSGTIECDSGIVSLVSSLQYVVASTSDGFIYVWNRATDVLQHRIAAAGSSVSHVSLAFLTDRLLVAAAADDMRLHMWDAASGDIVHSIALPPSVEHLNHLHVVSKQTILCSCGNRVLLLNFPKVREKLE